MNAVGGVLCLAALAFTFAAVEGSKILAVFPFPAKSHFIMLEALAKGLAERGHQVTVVGHFPQKSPIPNYRDVSLEGVETDPGNGTVQQIVNNVTVDHIFENWRPLFSCLNFIWLDAGVNHCKVMYEKAAFQRLTDPREKFDLLITELWGSDCFLPLANVLNVPHISMITTMEVPWSLGRYGSPLNPAHQVNLYLPHSNYAMGFWQRLTNALLTAYMILGHHFYSERPSNAIAKKYLGPSIPDLSEVVKNSSLLFVNAHFSTVGPRPFPPNVIDVGGLHITEPKPLPPDLKKMLDEAKEGVILVSFGSLIRADTLKKEILGAFVETFRKLPQKVLWKYNGTLPGQPTNLVTAKWLPQVDVLRHPNVKVFVTHGGLMGTQEAVAAGVPMLGVPFFADQEFNVINYQNKGFAILLQLEDVNQETVAHALHELLHNPRYKERAEHYSKLFMDRPLSALETAIYWTEYVIRHKGASHMRSAAADLSVVQYYLLDVVLFLLAAAAVVSALAVSIFKLAFRRIFGRKKVGTRGGKRKMN